MVSALSRARSFLVACRVYPRTSGAFRIENRTSVMFATESSRESANVVYMETRRVLFISLGAFSSRRPSQMAQSDCQEALDRKHANSYRNLENARKAAPKKKNYDTHKTRVALADIFQERFGNDPYDWQLDVAEAIILGLDSIVIAGTGSGKTMPFMMPLLMDPTKKIIIISPLEVLQGLLHISSE